MIREYLLSLGIAISTAFALWRVWPDDETRYVPVVAGLVITLLCFGIFVFKGWLRRRT